MTDDWTLNTEQMQWMDNHISDIDAAFKRDDMDTLRSLEATPEYITLFPGMSFDEAYDRYLSMRDE